MRELRYETRRTARAFVAGQLAEARELWILLHGYGETARDFLASAGALESDGRVLVAAEGLSRFYLRGGSGDVGASWMTKEDRAAEIDDYVASLDALRARLAPAPDVRTHVLGFSQGASTAFRWCVRSKLRPERLVLWGSTAPADLEPDAVSSALAGVRVVLVKGSRDAWVDADGWNADAARLKALDLQVEQRAFEGGHRLDDATLRALLK